MSAPAVEAARARALIDSGAGREPVTPAAIAGALGTQARVIRALILRETKARYGEHKLGFLWALIEPALMVTVFVAFFSAMNSDTISNMPIVAFMITGIVPFSMFRDSMAQMQGSLAQNRNLLGFPQVTTFDVILARGLLEGAILLCVFLLMLSLAHVLGFEIRCEDPLGVLTVCALLLLLGMGLGFIFASVSPVVPSVRQVGTVAFGRPLFLTSGLFYTADGIPMPFREWLLWNPLLHLLELQRSRFFHEFESTHASWTYAVSWSIGLFAFGLLTHQAMRKRAIVGL